MARIKLERGERSPFEPVRTHPRAPAETALKPKADWAAKPTEAHRLKTGSDLSRRDILSETGEAPPQVRVRFAPSPTGDLHIGGAYIALKNMMAARATPDGKFFVRIEDTDTERSLEKHTQGILKALAWLDIKPDEEIAYQSQRTALYRDKVEHLIAQGKAYVGERGAVFFKMPKSGTVAVNDAIRGRVKIDVGAAGGMGDYVIRRGDGTPTFLLANTVDDGEQGINLVIRGVDHLTNAARQVPLFEALGYDVPRFFHVPLVHGDDGGKLSKRKGATSVLEFQKEGVQPQVMINHLARLGYGYSSDKTLSLDELIHEFDPASIGKSKSRIGYEALYARNREFIAQQPLEQVAGEMKHRLEALAGDFGGERKTLADLLGPNGLRAAAAAARGRASTYQEAVDIAAWAMVPPTEYDERDIAAFYDFGVEKIRQNLGPVVQRLEALPADQWSHEKLQEILHTADKRDLPALRWMVTGSFSGLPLEHRLAIYGKEGSVGRLHHWLNGPRPADLPAPVNAPPSAGPPSTAPKFRFVPTLGPKGLDVNAARTALQNYLAAKKLGGTFQIRFDDLKATAKPEALRRAEHDLHWLGIDWAGEPQRQSARTELYTAKVNQLVEQGLAYRAENGTVMFSMRGADGLGFEDHVRGRVSADEDAELLKDYPLLEPDGRPSSLFAHVVDDGEEGITHLIRTDDQLKDALRERALSRALGYAPPETWHVRPLHDGGGAPKTTVEDLRTSGAKPTAVANQLARLGLDVPLPNGDLPLDRLPDLFDLRFSAESPAWRAPDAKSGRYIGSAIRNDNRPAAARPVEVMKAGVTGEGLRKIRDHLEESRRPTAADQVKRALQATVTDVVVGARPELETAARKALTEYEGAVQRIALMVPAESRGAFVEASAGALRELVNQLAARPERARRLSASVMAAAELHKGLQSTYLEGRLRIPAEALTTLSVEDARQVGRLTEAVDGRVGAQAFVTALPSVVSLLERPHGDVTPELHAAAVRTAVDALASAAPLAVDAPRMATFLREVQAEAAGPLETLGERVRTRAHADEQGLRTGAVDALVHTFEALPPETRATAEPLRQALQEMLEQHRGLTSDVTGAVEAVAQATLHLSGVERPVAEAAVQEAAGWVRGLVASPDAPALLQVAAQALAHPDAIVRAAAVSNNINVRSLVPALQASRGGDPHALAAQMVALQELPYSDRLEALVAEQSVDQALPLAAALPQAAREFALSEPRELRTFGGQLGGVRGLQATPKYTEARLAAALAASGSEVTPELTAKLNVINQRVVGVAPDAPLDALIRPSGKDPGLAALANPQGGFLHEPANALAALFAPLHAAGKSADPALARFAIRAAAELARLDRDPTQTTALVAQDLTAALQNPAALRYAPGIGAPASPSVAAFLQAHPALPPELALTAGLRLDEAQFAWLYGVVKGTRSRALIRDVRDFVFGVLAANRLDLLDAVRQAPPSLRAHVLNHVAVEVRQGRGAQIPYDAFRDGLARGVDPVLELQRESAQKAVAAMKLGDVQIDPTSDGPAQVQKMMPEISALQGVFAVGQPAVQVIPAQYQRRNVRVNVRGRIMNQVQNVMIRPEQRVENPNGVKPVHATVLTSAVRSALEGHWPAVRYEDDVAKRQLAGLKPEQVASWRHNKVFVPEAERAPLPDDAVALRLFTALQASVAKLSSTFTWRGGRVDLTDPAAVQPLRQAYEADLARLRSPRVEGEDAAEDARQRKTLGVERDALRRALSFVDLRAKMQALAGELPTMNREQRDDAWSQLRQSLVQGRAGLSQFGNRDFQNVSVELQQTLEAVSERPPTAATNGLSVRDGDSLEELLGSHYVGCLSAVAGANRHALMALLSNPEYKMARVYVGDKPVARGVWRLYQADWPDYKGPVLAVDNLQAVHAGDTIPNDGPRIFIQAALAKARALGIPLVSPNPHLQEEATRLHLPYDAASRNVIVDEGHSPDHQAEFLSVYWVPPFANGKSTVAGGAMVRADVAPGQKPKPVVSGEISNLHQRFNGWVGEPTGNREQHGNTWVQSFEHGKIFENGYVQLEGDPVGLVNGKRDAYLRYRAIVGRVTAGEYVKDGMWVQQCEKALVGDNGQIKFNGQNFWLVNGKLNAYLKHAAELGAPINEAYFKDGVWVQDFEHGQVDDNEQVRLNP